MPVVLAALLLLAGCAATESPSGDAPSAGAENAPGNGTATDEEAFAGGERAAGDQEAPEMDVLHGTWSYADDPRGEIQSDPVYEGSTITFGADGSYGFQLADTPVALEGTWEAKEWDESGGVVTTDYGEGRTNELGITLHRDGGEVVGIAVTEAQGATKRYYRRGDGE